MSMSSGKARMKSIYSEYMLIQQTKTFYNGCYKKVGYFIGK